MIFLPLKVPKEFTKTPIDTAFIYQVQNVNGNIVAILHLFPATAAVWL